MKHFRNAAFVAVVSVELKFENKKLKNVKQG